ncbi:hypothetical protein R1sor_013979 [Riccia sorocarpa]|uniref:Kinesin-like protein n=1 Tax=Riccia sorocarpa TaxID=122646 RepID=A0ABD3HB98_9MARC
MVATEGFQSQIEIHLRMRPVPSHIPTADYEVDHGEQTVEWVIPRQAVVGMHNHQREKYNFAFTRILSTETKQDEVFDSVAKKVIMGVLEGYNGTIFAYGQTGSGKTYTITGGTERNEEEALNLLFVGDTNRMISATPMNPASSRSHCIFTVSVEARKAGEDTVRRSKLHLVDLAGSERVWKKGIDGQILKEAKYINLSLHYLEQVIIALQERSQGKHRHHIPYRNSMMTSVLRDSLGGNCMTVMIATVTVAQEQLEETISTCRFAQRVALISNQVMVNEEVDPNLVIKRLKQEIKDLKEELNFLRGNQERDPLTASELSILRSQIDCYVADNSEDAPFNCGGTMVQIRAAFQLLKEMIRNKNETKVIPEISDGTDDTNSSHPVKTVDARNASTSTLQETISNLNHQLQQRDNEINILVSFIRKQEKGREKKTISTQWPELLETEDVDTNKKRQDPSAGQLNRDSERQQGFGVTEGDRLKAFELFKSTYPNWDAIEENKQILREKYQKAKSLGEKVNNARERINEMKAQVEKVRVDTALRNLTEGTEPSTHMDLAEEQLISHIDREKRVYKENFNDLRDIKKEIEHLHLILQQSRIRLQVDFEKWLNSFAKNEVTSGATSEKDFRNWMDSKVELTAVIETIQGASNEPHRTIPEVVLLWTQDAAPFYGQETSQAFNLRAKSKPTRTF